VVFKGSGYDLGGGSVGGGEMVAIWRGGQVVERNECTRLDDNEQESMCNKENMIRNKTAGDTLLGKARAESSRGSHDDGFIPSPCSPLRKADARAWS